MKTNQMKVLRHSKGALCVAIPNDDHDNFWLRRRRLHPGGGSLPNELNVISDKVSRKNVGGSAKRRFEVGEELGDHGGHPPQEAKA